MKTVKDVEIECLKDVKGTYRSVYDFLENHRTIASLEQFITDVAKAYAKEACREQRQICAVKIWPHYVEDVRHTDILTKSEVLIIKSPEPDLK